MIIKVQPDKQKAEALVEMAKITLNRIRETNMEKYPSNTLTDYYDVIHKIMEAITYTEGVKAKGEGAHQELIDYVCRKYNLGEATRIFLQGLRDDRNRISYEGFMIKEDYIKKNNPKIEKSIKQLLELINNNL